MNAVKACLDAEDQLRIVCGSEWATVENRMEVQAALVKARAELRHAHTEINKSEFGE